MSSIRAVTAHDGPTAVGIDSPAVRAGDTVYLAGQLPLDPIEVAAVWVLASGEG